jgi:hypothetical protein
MSAYDEQVKQAVAAMKAGRKDDARAILLDVVEQDERHETAWLYLSALVDTLEEQQICLENVLAINPANAKARKGLEALSQKLAAQKPGSTGSPSASPFSAPPPLSSAPAAPAPRPASSGTRSSSPFEAEFPGAPGNSVADSSPGAFAPYDAGASSGAAAPPPFDESLDWFSSEPETPAASEPPTYDPFASATSVDWGRDDKPAVYGSGKQVDLPSAQEYEDWVQGLNLGGEPAAYPPPPAWNVPESTSPFVPDGAAPFGDTSFMVDSGPAGPGDQPGGKEQPDPFGGDSFGTPWESEPPAFADQGFAESPPAVDISFPFGGESGDVEDFASPFGSVEPEPITPGRSAGQPPKEDDDLTFSFDDDDAGSALAATATPAAPHKAASAPQSGYFRYIPSDIEAAPGGIGLRSLMLLAGVVLLALLNVVSFAYLLL